MMRALFAFGASFGHFAAIVTGAALIIGLFGPSLLVSLILDAFKVDATWSSILVTGSFFAWLAAIGLLAYRCAQKQNREAQFQGQAHDTLPLLQAPQPWLAPSVISSHPKPRAPQQFVCAKCDSSFNSLDFPGQRTSYYRDAHERKKHNFTRKVWEHEAIVVPFPPAGSPA